MLTSCCVVLSRNRRHSGAMADDAAAKAAGEASAKKRRSYKLVVDPDLKVSVPLLCIEGPSPSHMCSTHASWPFTRFCCRWKHLLFFDSKLITPLRVHTFVHRRGPRKSTCSSTLSTHFRRHETLACPTHRNCKRPSCRCPSLPR